MTRSRLLALSFAAVAALALDCQAGQGYGQVRGQGGGGHARTPRYHPPAVPMYRGRVLRVPRYAPRQAAPARPSAPAHGVPGQSGSAGQPQQTHAGAAGRPAVPTRFAGNFRPPEHDRSGNALQARPLLNVTRNQGFVHQTVGDASFAKSAEGLAASERDGQYHWHDVNGISYSHWHDAARNRDWYGFYRGHTYFWTTYYQGHFWWREPLTGRYLVYWHDQWWWHGPGGILYVYIDDQYYQWLPNQNGVALVPTPTAPASEGGGEGLIVSSRPEFNYSADGTRMVQIEGEKLSAYLYVTSAEERDGSKPLKFLGDGVTSAAFTDTSKGEPLKIVLTMQDESGAVRTVVLDANGETLNSPPPAPAPPAFGTPGTPGFDAPPDDLPPTDAPFTDGQ